MLPYRRNLRKGLRVRKGIVQLVKYKNTGVMT